MILWNPCTFSKLLQKDTQFDVKKQTAFWIISKFKTIPWINTYFKRCNNYTVLACNQKRIYLCWVCIIWKLQCQANPHRWLAQTKVLSITAFFFSNNTSMYKKHISWKQWNSLKIYSTFHKPNKPVPARARKKKVGWQCKQIKKYWKGYPRYLHTYTSQGFEVFFQNCIKIISHVSKKISYWWSTL